jgi:hypothetical protein
MMRTASVARAIAVCIAILAAIDPAITSQRIAAPLVAVVAADAHPDSTLASRVLRTLGGKFAVVAAPLPSADATVLVGDRLPDDRGNLASPVVVLSSDRTVAAISIEAIDAPASTPLDARVSMTVHTRVAGARGRKVNVALRVGDVVVDRVERTVAGDDTAMAIPVTFTPTATGAVALHMAASIGDGATTEPAVADLAIDVRDRPWSILFFDPRPSWMSTFVRRAIEGDDRFIVNSRVVTSKNVSTDAGTPPSTLDDVAGVGRYDAVVIGAPEALTERDVSALETLLRRRAASVVLLMDQRPDGPYQRIVGAGPWLDNGRGRIEAVRARDGAANSTSPTDTTPALRASELAWPARLPESATILATSAPAKGEGTPSAAVIWREPVGAGELIVSGALDAWKYRDAALSAFDAYWRTLIADAANAAPRAVTVTLAPAVLAPGGVVTVRVTARDAALHALPVHSTATAVLQSLDGAAIAPIRLWPEGTPGEFRGTVRVPDTPGSYRVAVIADGNRADAALIVESTVSRISGSERELLDAWAAAHGGRAIAASHLDDLPAVIRAAIHATPRPTRWHPMRSAWWLLPFVVALSVEWWVRRRRGLR